MSEDSTRIEFKFEAKVDRQAFERAYRRCMPDSVLSSKESSIGYRSGKASYYAAFHAIGREPLATLLTELEQCGAQSPVAEIWIDSAGESVFFTLIRGKLQQFCSRSAMLRAQSDSGEKHAVALDFGKDGVEHTLAVRLHVSVARKRGKLFSAFRSALVTPGIDRDRFDGEVARLEKPKSLHDVGWLRFRCKDGNGGWFDVCSHDLLPALTDVVEAGESLFLAFDLARVADPSQVEVDDLFYYPFFMLDGVRKVWVKHFEAQASEWGWYTYFPNGSDESYFLRWRSLGADDWPDASDWPGD